MTNIYELQSVTKKLIGEFLNMSIEEVEQAIKDNPQKAKTDWYKLGKDKYYEETLVHLFGLADYNTAIRLEEVIFPFRHLVGLTILDFGGGIGSMSTLFADRHNVLYYDLPSKTQEFAKFMAKKLNKKIKFLTKEELLTVEPHIILAMDVLEHLDSPVTYVKMLTSKLKRGGYFLTTGLDFSIGPHTPMHLPENTQYKEEYENFMNENFFLQYQNIGKYGVVRGWIKK